MLISREAVQQIVEEHPAFQGSEQQVQENLAQEGRKQVFQDSRSLFRRGCDRVGEAVVNLLAAALLPGTAQAEMPSRRNPTVSPSSNSSASAVHQASKAKPEPGISSSSLTRASIGAYDPASSITTGIAAGVGLGLNSAQEQSATYTPLRATSQKSHVTKVSTSSHAGKNTRVSSGQSLSTKMPEIIDAVDYRWGATPSPLKPPTPEESAYLSRMAKEALARGVISSADVLYDIGEPFRQADAEILSKHNLSQYDWHPYQIERPSKMIDNYLSSKGIDLNQAPPRNGWERLTMGGVEFIGSGIVGAGVVKMGAAIKAGVKVAQELSSSVSAAKGLSNTRTSSMASRFQGLTEDFASLNPSSIPQPQVVVSGAAGSTMRLGAWERVRSSAPSLNSSPQPANMGGSMMEKPLTKKVRFGESGTAEFGATFKHQKIKDFLVDSSFCDGELYPKNKLQQLIKYLERRNVYVYGTEGPPCLTVRSNGPSTMLLPKNPTVLEVKHELSHYIDFRKFGFEAYAKMGRAERELSVLKRLKDNRIWKDLNELEKQASIEYVDKLTKNVEKPKK